MSNNRLSESIRRWERKPLRANFWALHSPGLPDSLSMSACPDRPCSKRTKRKKEVVQMAASLWSDVSEANKVCAAVWGSAGAGLYLGRKKRLPHLEATTVKVSSLFWTGFCWELEKHSRLECCMHPDLPQECCLCSDLSIEINAICKIQPSGWPLIWKSDPLITVGRANESRRNHRWFWESPPKLAGLWLSESKVQIPVPV